MCICIYVYMYICIYVYMYICIYVYSSMITQGIFFIAVNILFTKKRRLVFCNVIETESWTSCVCVGPSTASDEIPIDCNEARVSGGQLDHLGYCSRQSQICTVPYVLKPKKFLVSTFHFGGWYSQRGIHSKGEIHLKILQPRPICRSYIKHFVIISIISIGFKRCHHGDDQPNGKWK